MTDNAELDGILAATDDDTMPRIVETFTHLGVEVTIVEPCIGSADGIRRGYLWHAITGQYVLEPTHPGLYDETRWVPGGPRFLDDTGRLISTSSVSAAVARSNAHKRLSRLARAAATSRAGRVAWEVHVGTEM